jgi:hypothetical protein
MTTRDEVLREFNRPYQSHEDVGGPDINRMADEIVRLRAQVAAMRPVVEAAAQYIAAHRALSAATDARDAALALLYNALAATREDA